jgi:hypothetical protein
VNGLAQHCRTAGPRRRASLRDGDKKIANQCGMDDSYR